MQRWGYYSRVAAIIRKNTVLRYFQPSCSRTNHIEKENTSNIVIMLIQLTDNNIFSCDFFHILLRCLYPRKLHDAVQALQQNGLGAAERSTYPASCQCNRKVSFFVFRLENVPFIENFSFKPNGFHCQAALTISQCTCTMYTKNNSILLKPNFDSRSQS